VALSKKMVHSTNWWLMSKSKFWVFTLNNWTNEEWEYLVALTIDNGVTHCTIGQETGEGGTPHLQGYICFKNRKALTTIRRMHQTMARAHWEVRRGSHDEALEYCLKEGGGSHEYSAPDFVPSRPGQRTDLETLFQSVRDGMTERELWDQYPALMVRYQSNPVFRFLINN